MRIPKVSTSERGRPRSLRLRLVLWYGTLLAVALALFAALVLTLTVNAIDTSADSDVQAETRIAVLELSHKLSSVPPYWPPGLTLDIIDTYNYPGIVVDVVDAGGSSANRCASDKGKWHCRRRREHRGEARRHAHQQRPRHWYARGC